MRNLGFFLLCLFVSLPTPAEEANIWSGTSYHSQPGKLPRLDAAEKSALPNWNRETMTYKLSEDFALGLRRKGDLGGPGLDYTYSSDTIFRFAIIRSPVTGRKIPAITIGIAF